MHTHARMRETVKTRWEMQMFPNLMKCSAAAAAAHFNVYVSATTTVAKHLQKRGSCWLLFGFLKLEKRSFPIIIISKTLRVAQPSASFSSSPTTTPRISAVCELKPGDSQSSTTKHHTVQSFWLLKTSSGGCCACSGFSWIYFILFFLLHSERF